MKSYLVEYLFLFLKMRFLSLRHFFGGFPATLCLTSASQSKHTPKFNIDTKNDLEQVFPFKHGVILDIYLFIFRGVIGVDFFSTCNFRIKQRQFFGMAGDVFKIYTP